MGGIIVAGILAGIIGAASAFSATYGRKHKIIDYDTLRDEGETFIKRCNEEILFYTDLDPKFFNSPKIVEAIGDAISRMVSIQVIYDPQLLENNKFDEIPELRKMMEKGLIEAKAEKEPMNGHFVVGDTRHIYRDENPLWEFEEGEIIYSTATLGIKLRNKFDSRWKELSLSYL